MILKLLLIGCLISMEMIYVNSTSWKCRYQPELCYALMGGNRGANNPFDNRVNSMKSNSDLRKRNYRWKQKIQAFNQEGLEK